MCGVPPRLHGRAARKAAQKSPKLGSAHDRLSCAIAQASQVGSNVQQRAANQAKVITKLVQRLVSVMFWGKKKTALCSNCRRGRRSPGNLPALQSTQWRTVASCLMTFSGTLGAKGSQVCVEDAWR